MGVENNEAILATTWNDEVVEKTRSWIKSVDENLQQLFVIVPCICNGKHTILLAPSGSKKGWPEDDRVTELRRNFIAYLNSFNYGDGSSPFDWVEVGWGEFGQKVLRGNNINCYSDAEYAE